MTMCGRVIQSSGPLQYSFVDGMNVRDSRVHNYPPRWNAAPSQDLLVIRRGIVNFPSGSAHGTKITGTLIPPTGDCLIPMTDCSLRLDVRGTIKTDDGEFIFFEYSGVIVPTKEIMDR